MELMDLMDLLQPLLSLLVLITLGVIAGRFAGLGEEASRALVTLILKFTLPALIVVSLQRSPGPALLAQSVETLIWSLGFYALVVILCRLFRPLLPVRKDRKNLWEFAALFGNVGFMGFPILEALFGRESLFYAAIFNLPFNFIVFTYGARLLQGANTNPRRTSWKEVLLSPIILSLILALALFLLDLRLPRPVWAFLDLLGGVTTPLSMLAVGLMLSRIGIRASFADPNLWSMALARLVLAPALVLAAASLLPVTPATAWTAVILTAMPAAANTSILAVAYGGPEREASQLVLLTTLLVFFSLPIILVVTGLLLPQPQFL